MDNVGQINSRFLIENQEQPEQAPEAHPKTFKVHS